MATLSISLPAQIAQQVDTETQRQGFSTRSEFIRSLLRRYFSQELIFNAFEKKPLEEIKFELVKNGKYNQKFIESVVNGLSKSSLYAR